jgi:hypothetical protein
MWSMETVTFPQAGFSESELGAVNARRLIQLATYSWSMPHEL